MKSSSEIISPSCPSYISCLSMGIPPLQSTYLVDWEGYGINFGGGYHVIPQWLCAVFLVLCCVSLHLQGVTGRCSCNRCFLVESRASKGAGTWREASARCLCQRGNLTMSCSSPHFLSLLLSSFLSHSADLITL
ncbi:hypothetical protein CRENBAI_003364 [Crenichthys baileyi]|uniref:Uncharacterized protein n=1 Tax=Crenichthys baileyi TaxID=28760 RepID=A0AAV9S908_9TELE